MLSESIRGRSHVAKLGLNLTTLFTQLSTVEAQTFSLLDLILKQIPQQIFAAESLTTFQDLEVFKQNVSDMVDLLSNATQLSSLLACPLRQQKEYFCASAGSTIGSFGILPP
jgi:hypothetical protein